MKWVVWFQEFVDIAWRRYKVLDDQSSADALCADLTSKGFTARVCPEVQFR